MVGGAFIGSGNEFKGKDEIKDKFDEIDIRRFKVSQEQMMKFKEIEDSSCYSFFNNQMKWQRLIKEKIGIYGLTYLEFTIMALIFYNRRYIMTELALRIELGYEEISQVIENLESRKLTEWTVYEGKTQVCLSIEYGYEILLRILSWIREIDALFIELEEYDLLCLHNNFNKYFNMFDE